MALFFFMSINFTNNFNRLEVGIILPTKILKETPSSFFLVSLCFVAVKLIRV